MRLPCRWSGIELLLLLLFPHYLYAGKTKIMSITDTAEKKEKKHPSTNHKHK